MSADGRGTLPTAANHNASRKLFLLRHGETEFSRRDRFCGDIDAALTPEGLAMARAFADANRDRRWRAIVTSTRRRTMETAAPIAETAEAAPMVDARLDEIFYGDWQGMSKQEVAARDVHRYRLWLENPGIGVPRGEPVAAVADRALALVADICQRFDDGDVLLIGHKTVLRTLICRLTGLDLRHYRKIPQPVGGVTEVQLGAEPRIVRVGDVGYLPADLRALAQGSVAGAPAAQSRAA
ncbi:MAG TPA: histidine phosphatase family protein [Polyangia bacterium]|nr:histidine phosphatase family protein [Polyangia bacterium]